MSDSAISRFSDSHEGQAVSQKFLTHYQVLGVSANASEREIKIAYRKAARIYHPDHGGDPAEFRKVTEAYEVLGDPQQRANYDKNYGRPGTASAQPESPASGNASSGFGAPGRAEGGGRAHFSTSRRSDKRNVAGEAAVYEPPYDELNSQQIPLLPRRTAAQPVHGAPRKRGIFGASARLAREARTAQILMQQVLPAIPAARLLNGLNSPFGQGSIEHIVFSGYRIAVVGSMLLPDGAYRWDGSALLHGNKVAAPPTMFPAVRGIQELFPECNVTGWVCVQSTSGSLYEPVIDYARGTEPDGSQLVSIANAARMVREIKHFLAAGPTPNVVDVQILSRLLGGMY